MIGNLIGEALDIFFWLLVAFVVFITMWAGVGYVFGWPWPSIGGFLVTWGIIFGFGIYIVSGDETPGQKLARKATGRKKVGLEALYGRSPKEIRATARKERAARIAEDPVVPAARKAKESRGQKLTQLPDPVVALKKTCKEPFTKEYYTKRLELYQIVATVILGGPLAVYIIRLLYF